MFFVKPNTTTLASQNRPFIGRFFVAVVLGFALPPGVGGGGGGGGGPHATEGFWVWLFMGVLFRTITHPHPSPPLEGEGIFFVQRV